MSRPDADGARPVAATTARPPGRQGRFASLRDRLRRLLDPREPAGPCGPNSGQIPLPATHAATDVLPSPTPRRVTTA